MALSEPRPAEWARALGVALKASNGSRSQSPQRIVEKFWATMPQSRTASNLSSANVQLEG
jgi:hypothetical protein